MHDDWVRRKSPKIGRNSWTTNDFRIILIVCAIALFPVAIFHRVKSQSTVESLDRCRKAAILFTLRRLASPRCLPDRLHDNPRWMAWSGCRSDLAPRIGVGVGISAVRCLSGRFEASARIYRQSSRGKSTRSS